MVGEDMRFHGLPPLKRFKILEKERTNQAAEEHTTEVRRGKSSEIGAGVKVLCCLPAKKRVCAVRFFEHDDGDQENRAIHSPVKKLVPALPLRPLQPARVNSLASISFVPLNGGSRDKVKIAKSGKKETTRYACSGGSEAGSTTVNSEKSRCMQTISQGKETATMEAFTEKRDFTLDLNNDSRDATYHRVPSIPHALPGRGDKAITRPWRLKEGMKKTAKNLDPAKLHKSSTSFGTLEHRKLGTPSVDHGVTASTDRVTVPFSNRALPKLQNVPSNNSSDPREEEEFKSPKKTNSERSSGFKLEERGKVLKSEEELDDDNDDGVFCDICKEADADPSDPIVFCDGCNVMVHSSCYGSPLIDGIPDGDWFCRQCENEMKISKARQSAKRSPAAFSSAKHTPASRICCLCPSRKGAMKQTTDGGWAHLSCALYVPEVFYRRARDREEIDCRSVPGWRWDLICSICSTRGQGPCIQCTEVECCSTFHVSCALDAGLIIDYRNANPLTKTPAIVIAFCSTHSRQVLSGSERRRFKIVPR
ncbi:hypothetical protein KP509_08G035800 [Ceratopteris richardii]|uniref:Uncharacterized protein n=1 Tax=Ceratopteris richardii TaxID=49495 RepID=A0A8T2UD44_CERRI|nr:hypothetical protein KP509_08G035800 [Ceratopteris richardii]